MKPRKVTEADFELWGEGCVITPMLGQHVGAADIPTVIRQDNKVRVAWVIDERDNIFGLREGLTIWTTFVGGMFPTDLVIE